MFIFCILTEPFFYIIMADSILKKRGKASVIRFMSATQTNDKEYLFERMPVPGAVMQLSLPIVISSLVTILYNLADTFFVGMLNDPVQNAAVTLVYPVVLAFNAVNNLFGVGVSSAMSRHLGSFSK